MKVKLAEALLRRKELMHKVAQLHQIKEKDVLKDTIKRININDSLDEVRATLTRVKMADLTTEYDYYAGILRRLDGAIQNANWTTEIEVHKNAMDAFTADKEG